MTLKRLIDVNMFVPCPDFNTNEEEKEVTYQVAETHQKVSG